MAQGMDARQATLELPEVRPTTMDEALLVAFSALPGWCRRRGLAALMEQPAMGKTLALAAKAKLRKARRGR